MEWTEGGKFIQTSVNFIINDVQGEQNFRQAQWFDTSFVTLRSGCVPKLPLFTYIVVCFIHFEKGG